MKMSRVIACLPLPKRLLMCHTINMFGPFVQTSNFASVHRLFCPIPTPAELRQEPWSPRVGFSQAVFQAAGTEGALSSGRPPASSSSARRAPRAAPTSSRWAGYWMLSRTSVWTPQRGLQRLIGDGGNRCVRAGLCGVNLALYNIDIVPTILLCRRAMLKKW